MTSTSESSSTTLPLLGGIHKSEIECVVLAFMGKGMKTARKNIHQTWIMNAIGINPSVII